MVVLPMSLSDDLAEDAPDWMVSGSGALEMPEGALWSVLS